MQDKRLTRLALKAIFAYHHALRALARWIWAQTLPSAWSSRLYRRLYVGLFDL